MNLLSKIHSFFVDFKKPSFIFLLVLFYDALHSLSFHKEFLLKMSERCVFDEIFIFWNSKLKRNL